MKTTPSIEFAEIASTYILPFIKERAEEYEDEQIIEHVERLEELINLILKEE